MKYKLLIKLLTPNHSTVETMLSVTTGPSKHSGNCATETLNLMRLCFLGKKKQNSCFESILVVAVTVSFPNK